MMLMLTAFHRAEQLANVLSPCEAEIHYSQSLLRLQSGTESRSRRGGLVAERGLLDQP